MFGDSAEQHASAAMVCGQPIDGAAVGRPGQQLECKNQLFELIHPGGKGPKGEVAITTVCPTCRARDPLPVFLTTMSGEPWLTAGQIPQMAAQVAQGWPSGLLICACGHYRFALFDDGNEIFTACEKCKNRKQLGLGAGVAGQGQRQLGSWGEQR